MFEEGSGSGWVTHSSAVGANMLAMRPDRRPLGVWLRRRLPENFGHCLAPGNYPRYHKQ